MLTYIYFHCGIIIDVLYQPALIHSEGQRWPALVDLLCTAATNPTRDTRLGG